MTVTRYHHKYYCKSVRDDYEGMFNEGDKCPACEGIIKKAKEWFGDGEVDVDAMINSGSITEEYIVNLYRNEVLGEPLT